MPKFGHIRGPSVRDDGMKDGVQVKARGCSECLTKNVQSQVIA